MSGSAYRLPEAHPLALRVRDQHRVVDIERALVRERPGDGPRITDFEGSLDVLDRERLLLGVPGRRRPREDGAVSSIPSRSR